MFGGSGMFGNKSFTSNTGGFGTTSSFGPMSFTSNSGPDGSTIAFEPFIGKDTMIRNGDNKEIQTKNMCITAMPQYEMKSIEELRVADYAANRKGNTGASSGGGMFGTTVNKPGGIFGATTTNKPSSIFGSPAQQTTTGFGLTSNQFQPSTGGLFGNTTNQASTTSSIFGNATKPAATGGGLFGAGTTTSAFGQQQQQTGGSLFGQSAPQATGSNLFGNTAATGSSGIFGTGTSNAFGTPKPAGSLFGTGSTTTSAFGTTTKPAQPTSNLFGSTTNQSQPTSSLFGPTTNQSQPSTGLFGNTPASTGGIFGSGSTNVFGQQQQQPTGGSIFGQNANTQPTGGLFSGATNPASTNMFGAQAVAQQPAPQPIFLGGKDDENAVQRAILESQLSNLPYGDSPNCMSRSSSTLKKNENPSKVQSELRKLANQALSSPNNTSLSNLSDTSILSPPSNFSYKPLVALPSLSFAPVENRSSLNLSLHSTPGILSKRDSFLNDSKTNGFSPKSFDISVLKSSKSNTPQANKVSTSIVPPRESLEQNTPESSRKNVCFADLPQIRNVDFSIEPSFAARSDSSPVSVTAKSILVTPETRRLKELNTQEQPIESLSMSKSNIEPDSILNSSHHDSSLLYDEGYYVEPSLEELEKTLRNGKYFVRGGLTVGRHGYGSVFWPNDFELSSLDFESLITFRSKEVVVYPDDATKPPLGVDLNRPAEVSLQNVWPFDKETKIYIKDPATLGKLQFCKRLERACQRMDARFIDYRVSTGTWTFAVSHFSRYGFADEDDEDENMPYIEDFKPKKEENMLYVEEHKPIVEDVKMYTRQHLVSRDRDESLFYIPPKKILRLHFADTYVKVPRPQWHPSEPFVILKQIELNAFKTQQVPVVPLLTTCFEKYLEAENRLDELPDILKNPILNFNPPSVFVELLDSFIFAFKKGSSPIEEKEEAIYSLCAAILLSPTTPNYLIQQRKRVGKWIQQHLAPFLTNILKNVTDEDHNLATRVIFECLVHGNVKEAVKQAMRFKYFNLALFISLYNRSTSMKCKEAIATQHYEANRIFHNCHKDKYLIGIYQILAGPKSDDNHLRNAEYMSCYDGLSWIQIFGTFVWYGCSPADGLREWNDVYSNMVDNGLIPAKPENLV